MSEQTFKLKYDGSAIINGEIDVADFAPSVLAVGELFRMANELLNGGRSTATVKLKATNEGSFEVLLNIDFSMLEAFKDFLDFAHENNTQIKSATDLLDLLIKGGAVIGAPVSLFFLIKKLKGDKPKFVKKDKRNIVLEINDERLEIDSRVLLLYENYPVRKIIEKATAVLERPGISNISFEKESDPETKVNIGESDRQYFKVPNLDESEEEITKTVFEMRLQTLSVSFKDGNKWRFTMGDEAFMAAIEDADFLNQISNNEISFSKGDIYVCDVLVIQRSTSKGLHLERIIQRVKKHYPGGRQLRLL